MLVVPLLDPDPDAAPNLSSPATDAVGEAAKAGVARQRGQSQGAGMVFDGPPLPPGEEIVEEEVVAHLDGRDYLTRAQLRAKGLEPWARKVCVGCWGD